MAIFHPQLTSEKWFAYPRATQILNIAAELTRAKNQFNKNTVVNFHHSLDRAIELIDITMEDPKWQGYGLRELKRLREMLGDFYSGRNESMVEFQLLLKTFLKFDGSTSQVEV